MDYENIRNFIIEASNLLEASHQKEMLLSVIKSKLILVEGEFLELSKSISNSKDIQMEDKLRLLTLKEYISDCLKFLES